MPQVLGSTAANVLAGILVGQPFLRGAALSHGQRIRFMAWFALGLLAAGLLLRPYHHINKIAVTESYTLVCSALILALFVFYIVIDVRGAGAPGRWCLCLPAPMPCSPHRARPVAATGGRAAPAALLVAVSG